MDDEETSRRKESREIDIRNAKIASHRRIPNPVAILWPIYSFSSAIASGRAMPALLGTGRIYSCDQQEATTSRCVRRRVVEIT